MTKSPNTETILAFDYGKRRIGIAQGQTLTYTSSPLTTLTCQNGEPDWSAINKLIEQWQPNRLIVGLPLQKDGSESELSKAASQFADSLAGRTKLPVELHDETLSSYAAHDLLRQQRQSGSRNKRVQKQDIDQMAAAIILQSWLNELSQS